MPNIGDRVRVQIADESGWTRHAVESMNGATGTVEEESAERDPWGREKPLALLVRFDAPRVPLWSSGSEVRTFWFGPADLVLERA